MANEQHLSILRQGVDAWNGWRRIEHVDPDLSGADLSGAFLEHADLSGADLRGAILEDAALRGANLQGAKLEGCTLRGSVMESCKLLWVDLSGRDLSGKLLDSAELDEADLRGAQLRDVSLVTASLSDADLRGADLQGSVLIAADLSFAKLSGANLRWCDLGMAVLADTDLAGADLTNARFNQTILANLDLSAVRGLRAVKHQGPSSIGTDTLERTLTAVGSDQKRLREVAEFFRDAGVEEHLLAYFRSRAGGSRQYQPAYVIHARSDAGFAQMLSQELKTRGVRCWLHSQRRLASSAPILGRMLSQGPLLILCASTAALETEWAQEVIRAAVVLEKEGQAGFLAVDLDGCLRDGRAGQHAEWIRRRMAADLSKLTDGESGFEETIESVLERLRDGTA